MRHCYLYLDYNALLATIQSVANWVAQLGFDRIKTKIIKDYVCDFRFAHIDRDYSNYIFIKASNRAYLNVLLRGQIDLLKHAFTPGIAPVLGNKQVIFSRPP